MNKIAAITGITGQDGSYLLELLLDNPEYRKVIGLQRRSSSNNLARISHLLHHPKLILEEFDLTDSSSVSGLFQKYEPDEFYNLAAQSHVGTSFSQPGVTFSINALGVTNILDSILKLSTDTRLYQASTSEMFGKEYSTWEVTPDSPNLVKYQDENTEFKPQSPYGVSKLAAHNMVRIYREAYGLFACCGILFNHESPRRGVNFVTKKITNYIGQLENGLTSEKLKLGNLKACRDWGHAKDYVKAMYLMLQQNTPQDYVVSSDSTHSIEEFLVQAFGLVNKDYHDYVEIDPSLFRPAEVDYLCGNSTKAKNELGWKPEISFDELVKDMVDYDVSYYKSLA